MGWDAGFLLYLQDNIRSDVLTPVMKFITHTGDKGIVLIALVIILLIIPKMRQVGIIAAVSIAFEALITNLFIKNIVARTRPYDSVEGLVSLIEKQKDYSFPSGHSGAAFAVAGVLIVIALLGLPAVAEAGKITRTKMTLAYKLFAVLMIIYAAVLAFSRMYVGVHYPTDILGGTLLGVATSFTAYFAYHVAIRKISVRKTLKTENA